MSAKIISPNIDRFTKKMLSLTLAAIIIVPKRLKLRTSNMTRIFPGTVQT